MTDYVITTSQNVLIRVNILLLSHRTGSDVTCEFIHTERVDMVQLAFCYVLLVFGVTAPQWARASSFRGF